MKNTSQKSSKKVPPPSNFYENYDAQLNEWSQKLNEFRKQLTQLGSELQMEASQKIERLEKKYDEASSKISDLKSKGLNAKDELKIGFEKAWKELIQAFDEAKKTFH